MALLADGPLMAAGQREGRVVVIDGGIPPGIGVVARPTLGAEGAIVRIVGGVAGNAGLRCPSVDPVDVALRAGHTRVSSGQREGGLTVIEVRRLPGVCGVAGTAVRA